MLKVSTVLLAVLLLFSQHQPIKSTTCEPSANLAECVQEGNPTDLILVANKKYPLTINLTSSSLTNITGNNATIDCENQGNGLIFEHSSGISIRNLTILHCGRQIKSSRSKGGGHTSNDTVQFQSALHFRDSSDVELESVDIHNSNGTGLSFINCSGSVTISKSNFTGNQGTTGAINGGSGVYIEELGEDQVNYSLSDCRFVNNSATSKTSIRGKGELYKDVDHLFGMGGGVAVNLGNSHTNVEIDSCVFEHNKARRGGGVFVYFLKGSSSNTVHINDSNFTFNNCPSENPNLPSSGGGLGVLYLANPGDNTCNVSYCNFSNNMALFGGGLSMGTEKYKHRNKFLIQNSTFRNNSAQVGAAMDLFCYSYLGNYTKCPTHTTVQDLQLIKNNGLYNKNRTSSTLHVESTWLSFEGHSIIQDNEASGIGLESSILKLRANSLLLLEANMGREGGGIAAVGNSELHFYENFQLTFEQNMADAGGAMYFQQVSPLYTAVTSSCFMKYFEKNSRVSSSPCDWQVNVSFKNNTASGELNAFFVTSVLPCLFNNANATSAFCGCENWNFSGGKCEKLIETLPKRFKQPLYEVSVLPNIQTKIEDFKVFDDFSNDVTNSTDFTTSLLDNQQKIEHMFIETDIDRNGITVRSNISNGSLQFLLQTAYHRSISTTLTVNILGCLPGYTFKNSTSQCECSENFPPYVKCIEDTKLGLFLGICIGQQETGSKIIVTSKCPFTVSNFLSPIIPVTLDIHKNSSHFNREFCGRYSRQGLLCSKCLDGMGIDIFSPTFNCHDCNSNNTYLEWIKAVSAVIGPQTIFFIVVIIFHIGIMAPSTHGYIFFSHMVVLPLNVLLLETAWKIDPHLKNHAHSLSAILLDPYRIWSFDYPEIFNLKVCLGTSIRIMHAIAFRYIAAFYPVILLLVALLFIELHARNCRPVVYLWKPLCILCVRFRRNWKIHTSVIDSFATLVLLSYSKIINTSLYLLTHNNVYALNGTLVERRLDYDTSVLYFRNEHVIFGSVAILILCTFGAIPPLLLLLYSNRWFHRLLTKVRLDKWQGLHMFVETFHGAFKNGTGGSPDRRWFSGIYFIFRLIIFLIFALTNDLTTKYCYLTIAYTTFLLFTALLRPYKNSFFTWLDASFMAILVINNAAIVYLITQVQLTQKLPVCLWHFVYFLYNIPTVYLLCYIPYLMLTRSKSTFIQRHFICKARRLKARTYMFFANTQRASERQLLEEDSCSIISGDEFPTHTSLEDLSITPDRVDNPHRYYNMSTGDLRRLEMPSSTEVSVNQKHKVGNNLHLM